MRRSFLAALACAAAVLAVGAPLMAQPVIVETGTGFLQPTRMPGGPAVPPEGMSALAGCPLCGRLSPEADGTPIPIDPRFNAAAFAPSDPPVTLNYVSMDPAAKRAPTDFATFRLTTIGSTEMGGHGGFVNEPTFGVAGRTVFWAGNFYATVSGDYGQTFTYRDARDNFPHDGQLDVVLDSHLCCDQVVYFDRTRSAYFWLLLYHVNCITQDTNVQRIAVAAGQEAMIDNDWFIYDFSPASFGYPAHGYWMDFPYMCVSNNYLYHITKLLDWHDPDPLEHPECNVPIPGASDETASKAVVPPTRTLVARYSLNEMSRGQPISYSWFIAEDVHGMRGTHGATTSMYFGAHRTTTNMRIYRWQEANGVLDFVDRDHNGFLYGAPGTVDSMTAPGPDGLDWARWSDNWIWGAWDAAGTLGFMVPSRQGGGYPYPNVQVIRFRESDRAFVGQNAIWSTDFGVLYPSVHPNDRGHVAGNVALGGPTLYPTAASWIVDDVNGNSFAGLTLYMLASGTNGPIGARWGDYLTTVRNVPYGNTWGGSGIYMQGGTADANARVRYIWFGRERDRPPTIHAIYVDRLNTTGWEDGTALHPFNTVAEGHFACVAGDTLVIRGGTYPEVVNLGTAITVRNEAGTATVGQ
jgi:hypothetical protein